MFDTPEKFEPSPAARRIVRRTHAVFAVEAVVIMANFPRLDLMIISETPAQPVEPDPPAMPAPVVSPSSKKDGNEQAISSTRLAVMGTSPLASG